MILARNMARHMTDEISVYDPPERDHRGVIGQKGFPRSYNALIEWKEKLIVSATGENIVSRARIYIKGDPDEIKAQSWVILPGGEERQVITTSHWSHGGFVVIEV